MPFAFCQLHGFKVMCGPRGLPGEPDHLFHNNGDGTFTDVSVKAGVSDPGAYYGFTAIFVDVNNDGKPDLLVANDSEPNYLYINKGDGTFDDQSYISGFALNNDGREIASMGLAVGDYMNNGLLDLLVTDFSDDYKALYHNDGDASFTEIASGSRTGADPSAVCRLGRRLHRLRQRWLERRDDDQRPRLSAGRRARLGHDFRGASAAVS